MCNLFYTLSCTYVYAFIYVRVYVCVCMYLSTHAILRIHTSKIIQRDIKRKQKYNTITLFPSGDSPKLLQVSKIEFQIQALEVLFRVN